MRPQSVWTLVYSLTVCLWVGLSIKTIHAETQPENPLDVVNRMLTTIQEDALDDMQQNDPKKSGLEALELIDLSGLSHRLLGKYWSSLSPEEQREFTTLFGDLLMGIAFPQSARFMSGLERPVMDEHIDGSRAVVATILNHPEEGNITIDYLLKDLNGQWRVHDIEMDGVSLSRNLRTQFKRIITHYSYAELIHRMREKLANQ